MRIVGAVSRAHKGESLGELAGISSLGVVVSGSVEEALAKRTDVLIDFTSPDVVKENVILAIGKKVSVVIGTSGLTDHDYAEIARRARRNKVGVIAGGNFAISAVLLEHFASMAARYMPSWEVVDYATDAKLDAPSGTARQLAYALSAVGRSKKTISIRDTRGAKESRGYSLRGTQIHSIRLPGYVIGTEAVFGKNDERLSIRQDAGSSPEPYVEGVLLAARRVGSLVGLRRGLWEVLSGDKRHEGRVVRRKKQG
jgi:4-hydroxy-tetrahydrodipicolinate reductase